MTLNFSVDTFLAYSGWFPVQLIVLFWRVVINLYVLVTVCFFSINALTSLYIKLPSFETGYLKKIYLTFLGGLSLHLNHLIASHMTNYDWPFRTLPFELLWSNLDTKDLETHPRTFSSHFWNMSLFDYSRAIWVLFQKWVVSENQSFLNEGVII